MRIIQSYWSKPSLQNKSLPHGSNNRFSGGWLSEEYHAMSWALSVLKLLEHYDEVDLYTDQIGKEWLIEKLALPYTNVICTLDELNDQPPLLWALPKVYTYAQQKGAFLHVDSDVYIWEKIDTSLFENTLYCQNIDVGFENYNYILQQISQHFTYLPDFLQKIKLDKEITAINAGVIGGKSTDFFQQLATHAFEFIAANKEHLGKVDTGLLNVVFEQLFFYELAKKQAISPGVLFEDVGENYAKIMQFNLVPLEKKYIHLIGFAKRNKFACLQLASRLQYEYPDTYERIKAIYNPKVLANHHSITLPEISAYTKTLELLSDLSVQTKEVLQSPQQLENKLEAYLSSDTNTPLQKSILFDTYLVESVQARLQQNIKKIDQLIKEEYSAVFNAYYTLDSDDFLEEPLELNSFFCELVYVQNKLDYSTKSGIRISEQMKNLKLPSGNHPLLISINLTSKKVETNYIHGWDSLLSYIAKGQNKGSDLIKILQTKKLNKQNQNERKKQVLQYLTMELVVKHKLKFKSAITDFEKKQSSLMHSC